MKTVAIICEYNPFHNGHKYQIDTIRANNPECTIISMMTGNFVQRGDCAVISKHNRAEAALLCGVDAVFELPSVFSISSARDFASAGIYALSALGSVDEINFGSECGDIYLLKQAALRLSCDEFEKSLKDILLNEVQLSYAKSIYTAYCRLYGENAAEILLGSNNILALEYIKAIHAQKSTLAISTIKRAGGKYDSYELNSEFSSASAIRNYMELHGVTPRLQKFLPNGSFNILKKCDESEKTASLRRIESAVISHLRRFTPDELLKYSDITPGFEYQLKSAADSSISLDELINKLVSKKYSSSRARRAVLSVFFDITHDIAHSVPSFIRLLAANDKGCEFLSHIRHISNIPIITKPSAVYKAFCTDSIFKRQFKINLFMDNMYNLALKNKNGTIEEIKTSPLII